MVKDFIARIAIIISLLCFFSSFPALAKDEEEPQMSIVLKMKESDIYKHEPVGVVVTLRTNTTNIAFVKRPEKTIFLKKGEFDTFQTVTPAGNPYEEKSGNRTYYYYPLDAYMISMSDKGKFHIECNPYQIGVYKTVVATDRFGRRFRTRDVETFEVTSQGATFKVKDLPTPPASMDFSGSVGDFTIETIVPPGDIFINEEATAYIVLKGSGMIAESTLPEYRGAFSNGVKLKSISESRDEGHINGSMMSEIQLECTFIPTSREDAEIGEVRFDYFDPKKGKYVTARSAPVKIKVKSSTAKRENMSI